MQGTLYKMQSILDVWNLQKKNLYAFSCNFESKMAYLTWCLDAESFGRIEMSWWHTAVL